MGGRISTTQNVFRIRAQALRACISIWYYNHLTCHISRCSRAHLASYSGRHPLRVFKYGEVHGEVHAVLQTTTWHWVATFTPFFRVSICRGARGNVTDVHVVTSYGFTVVGKPQEESSPVHNFLLASMVIFHHIGRYPVRHAGHHHMHIVPVHCPLVSALWPLPYGRTAIFAFGPPLRHSPALSPVTF